MTRPDHLLRLVLAGAATGLRSTVALGALVDAGVSGLPAPLQRPRARSAVRVAVGIELVADKLPSTRSRLERRGLFSRVVAASVAGAVLARGADQPVSTAVVVAAASALVAARLGHDVRAVAAQRFPPFAAAASEDALALTLAMGSAGG